MRFSFTLIALSSACATVSARLSARQLPNCAAPCLTGSSVNFGGCNQQDDTCLCNSQAFIQSSTQCIQSSCSGSDLTTAEQLAQALCLSVGVTLTASSTSPTPTAPASSGSPSSSGSSGSSSASLTSSTSSSTSPSPTKSPNSALSNSANAFAGIAAAGIAALIF